MPKLKDVTPEEIEKLIDELDDSAGRAADIGKRAEATFNTTLPKCFDYSRSLLARANTILRLAQILMTKESLARMQAEMESTERK